LPAEGFGIDLYRSVFAQYANNTSPYKVLRTFVSSTRGAVHRRLWRRFHMAQNSASSGSNPIVDPVLKKGRYRLKTSEAFSVSVRRRWGKVR
jgi:hypothetical protein